jgi:membrane protein YdbS with pleckstrin-like domain
MIDWFRKQARRACRIPPPPEAPAGSPESVRIFQAAPNFYKLRVLHWVLRQIGLLAMAAITLGPFIAFNAPPLLRDNAPLSEYLMQWENIFFIFSIVTFVLQLPFSFALVRLDYELRWYIVTDRCLRIRQGVWRVEERTMSFANIQEVNIQQGPLQRALGLWNLMVRSAGGGAMPGQNNSGGDNPFDDLHVGTFQGIDNAEEVRDLILARLRAYKDAGLGDPDDIANKSAGETVAATPDAIAAARQVLSEAQMLHRTIGSRGGLFEVSGENAVAPITSSGSETYGNDVSIPLLPG